jgi:hypothetical protein
MVRSLLVSLSIAASTVAASAQHHAHGGHQLPAPAGASPYAGFQTRAIKALSEREIDNLRAGRGMGLALAAEMNGYPGPMHVLEHADALRLTDEQRRTMERLMSAMRLEAIAAGERLIAAEMALDRLFAFGAATDDALAAAMRLIGEAQAEVRRVHLSTHIATPRVLTLEQIAVYAKIRGY